MTLRHIVEAEMAKMKPGEKLHILRDGEIDTTITRQDPVAICAGKTAIAGPDEAPGKTST